MGVLRVSHLAQQRVVDSSGDVSEEKESSAFRSRIKRQMARVRYSEGLTMGCTPGLRALTRGTCKINSLVLAETH